MDGCRRTHYFSTVCTFFKSENLPSGVISHLVARLLTVFLRGPARLVCMKPSLASLQISKKPAGQPGHLGTLTSAKAANKQRDVALLNGSNHGNN